MYGSYTLYNMHFPLSDNNNDNEEKLTSIFRLVILHINAYIIIQNCTDKIFN